MKGGSNDCGRLMIWMLQTKTQAGSDLSVCGGGYDDRKEIESDRKRSYNTTTAKEEEDKMKPIANVISRRV